MAQLNNLLGTIFIPFCLLFFLASCRTSNSFDADLQEQIQQLRGNYERMEIKVGELTTKVTQLEAQLLKEKSMRNSIRAQSDMRRTCSEIKSVNPNLNSGMYWIDPDGQDVGDDPIEVHCDMSSGTTSILHDSEEYVEVDNCFDSGCYTREINYLATDRQITKLIELSNECHQYFKYDCIEAPFEYDGQQVSWWDDRYGNSQYFWSGKHTNDHTCDCGIHGTCIGGSTKKCNCDSLLSDSYSDHGIITDKEVLPIKRLQFGYTTGSGGHTLGKLECSGETANEIVDKIPTSCADLRALGHTSSGFYLVQGTDLVETIYCDFTKLQNEEGFEKWIGYADLKPEPTYYGLPKSCEDLRGIGHTSFSSGMYPIMGEKRVEMVYCEFTKSQEEQDVQQWMGYADLKAEPTFSGMPKSCADLIGIGHTLFSSGMYSIMGQKFVEVVYCDFTKSQNEQGFQEWLGYADLKAEPTYFGMPKSCADLIGIGHTTFSSGLYPILGGKFVEMVYCDFNKSSNNKDVGVIDVKSNSTFFYGQRQTSYAPTPGLSKNIPFDVPQNTPSNLNVLNIGNAWDINRHHFEAPVKGRYFFSASGAAGCRTGALTCQCFVSLMKKTISGTGTQVGGALGEIDMERRDKTSSDSETFTIQSTLDLNKGDKIWLEVDSKSSSVATLTEDPLKHLTHFIGILLQEDIVDSLNL